MLKAKKGRLLISEPSVSNDIFFKSVILLTHYNKEESIGVILNHPTDINLNEILNNIPSGDFPIYIGGPVAKNSIQFIHTLGNKIPESIKITNDLYWGGDFKEILSLMKEKKLFKEDIRFFAGYSGWGINQLDNEIKNKSWIVTESRKDYCMNYSDQNLWSKIIKTQGNKHAIWANLTKNPHLN